jgi:hypothetical protein
VQKDVGEENIVEVEIQLSIKVQVMAKAQQGAMEIERHELEVIAKKRLVILNKATLLKKGTKILDPKRFMWTQTNKIMIGM